MQMEKCEKLVTKLLLIVLCTAGVVSDSYSIPIFNNGHALLGEQAVT